MMEETDEGQAKDSSGNTPQGAEGANTPQGAEGSVMEEMLVSGLVKPAEFKPKTGQKYKTLSKEEKKEMLTMVNDLDKYKDSDKCEKSPSPEKVMSPVKKTEKSAGSLFSYVDSELACLHGVDKQVKLNNENVEDKSEKKDQKSAKSEKKDHKPASVSAEQQMQFESLLKEDSAKSGMDEQDKSSLKSKDNVSNVSDVIAGKEIKKDGQQASQKSAREKELKLPKESQRKKKEKKDQNEYKGPGKKNVCSNPSDGASLGSYSQLLISMGRRSPNRKIEIVNQPADMPASLETENQSSGKKRRNRKKKGNQQLDDPPSSEVHVKPEMEVSNYQRPQSAGKKKKNKPLPNQAQEVYNHQSMGNKQQGAESVQSNTKASKHQPVNEDVDDNDFIEATVNLPKTDHMHVIGPQGRHLQEILIETGVCVSVPKLNSKSEEIVLRGDRTQIGTAMSLMFQMSDKAKMECRSRQGQSGRATGQGSQKQGQQKHNQGQVASDLSYQMERQLNLNDNSNGARMKSELCAGNIVKQSNQQGSRQVKGHKGNQQGQGHQGNQQGQGHQGNQQGHGHQGNQQGHQGNQQGQGHRRQGNGRQYDNLINLTPRREADQSKGQGKRQRRKKVVFYDHMSQEELAEGLKNGALVQGPLRINPRNYDESYVRHPDGKSDILISGMKARNRALNGDTVAVHILDEGEWKIHNSELAGLEHASEDSDPEVVIESEEIVEVIGDKNKGSTKGDLAQKGADQGKYQKDNKGACQSPKKWFTTLNEMMSDQSPVKKTLQTESGMEKVKKLLQRTGIVVGIIEKRNSMTCAGHIKLMQDKNPNRALFHPNDHRMPRVVVPMCDCPKDFLQRPEDYANTLYVCRMEEWKPESNFPEGSLVKKLGEKGEIEPETEGMLYENEVDFSEFPEQALECLPPTPWSIPATEFDYRRDFRSSCVFTIDPATARDLDDALSCEDLGDGRYKVGVHIADVSYFVSERTDLDTVASSRSTSVYLVHRVIPMLPRLLCEQLCSLNPDEDRLTFSVEWTINEQGEVEDEWFGRSVIRSCVKLAYDHAQGFIEEPERDWTTDELPAISEKFTVNDIKTRVLNLHKIAVQLRKTRMEGGALRLDQIKLQYSLDQDSGLPNGYSVYQQKDSNRLVEEFMLMANMAVAHKINSHFPEKSILRRHPPPQEKMVENLKEQCSGLGIHLDVSSSQALQVSLRNYAGDDAISMARMQVLTALCAKPMQNAEYFCTGCLEDESLYHHYALNVPLYTHFTSPIRRYPDILVHRLLGAALGYCENPSRSPGELEKIAKHCNDKKTNAKRVGDLSSDLFFSIFVQTVGPLEEKAMVMSVLDKAFDVFVLELGVSKRVYCDKLDIKEKVFKQNRKVPCLTLVWESVEGEPEIRQEITIFSMVECVIERGDQPLQWTAVIKRPLPVML